MHIISIKNKTIKTITGNYELVEVKVNGKPDVLRGFFTDIQEGWDLAHDEWNDSSTELTMTFDKNTNEQQTVKAIKRFANNYIEELEDK